MDKATTLEPDAGLPAPLRLLRAADRRLQQVEVAVCLTAFLLMIGLAFAQVFLRTFRGGPGGLEPIGWFDIVARHLVIWVGMLGASLATAEGRHISVEVLPKLLSDAGKKRLDVFLSLVSAAVVAALLALSLVYMARVQLPNESELFAIERLHMKVFRWPFLVIVPVGLAVIVWRLLLRAAESVVMTTAQFHEREAALEREVQDRERAQEADGAALLVEADRVAAAESGRPAALTPEAARDELRRLASGRAEQAPTDPAPAGAPGTETERLPLAGPLTPRPTPPPPSPSGGPRAVPGRSTDEIPVYRDLGDDEDLVEPDARTTESSDGLEPRAADAAEDAVEAVADTARLRGARADEGDDASTEGDASAAGDEERPGETARVVAPSAIGPTEDLDHVPERQATVRMPGSGRAEAGAPPAGTEQPPPGGGGAAP